jgi:hypothetical protein
MAGIPEGFVNGAQSASMDIMAVTGIRFDVAADHKNVDDRSGKALREFNRPQDLGASHYMDNLKRSLIHTGRMLIDLIPHYYDEKRVMTILREDDTEQRIEIDPHAPKPYDEKAGPDGQKMPIFNPTIGKYGVTVTIGPSFATKRIEAAESMLEFAKVLGPGAHIIMDLIAKNMDWDGSEEIASRLAKAVPAQLMTPDQKDIPPQMQAYLQSLEAQLKQAGVEKQQLLAALNDKGADRAIAQDKIDRDFEAKILKIISDGEANAEKMMIEKVKVALEQLRSEESGAREDRAMEAEPAGKPGDKEKKKPNG